jgi:SAM-dependent methyltransferase
VPNDRYLRALHVSPSTSEKVVCRQCGHIYANPQLSTEELRRLYGGLYRSPALGYAEDGPSREYLYWKTLKAKQDYQWLRTQIPRRERPGAALEVGCAEGLLLSLLATDGWSVLGVEPTATYATHARREYGVEVIEAIFEDAPLQGRQFDLIIAMDVLEHIKDPVAFLTRLQTLLAPEGVAYITTPNLLRLANPIEELSSPHLSLFTPDTLRRTFVRCGFAVVGLSDRVELAALAQLAEPARSMEPIDVPASRAVLRRAIIRARLQEVRRKGVGVARQAVKRGLRTMMGQQRSARLLLWLRRGGGKSDGTGECQADS